MACSGLKPEVSLVLQNLSFCVVLYRGWWVPNLTFFFFFNCPYLICCFILYSIILIALVIFFHISLFQFSFLQEKVSKAKCFLLEKNTMSHECHFWISDLGCNILELFMFTNFFFHWNSVIIINENGIYELPPKLWNAWSGFVGLRQVSFYVSEMALIDHGIFCSNKKYLVLIRLFL